MSLTLIAAMAWPDRVIGAGDAIPWRLGADLKRFKALTLGHPVVMGRKTWESLPFKLPGRTNIVLSRTPLSMLRSLHPIPDGAPNPGDRAPDAWAGSLEEARNLAAQAPGGAEIFVIGGAQLYAQTLPFADRLALTLIHHPFAGDARFPALDLGAWIEVSRQKSRADGDPAFEYEFLDLTRSRPQGEA